MGFQLTVIRMIDRKESWWRRPQKEGLVSARASESSDVLADGHLAGLTSLTIKQAGHKLKQFLSPCSGFLTRADLSVDIPTHRMSPTIASLESPSQIHRKPKCDQQQHRQSV